MTIHLYDEALAQGARKRARVRLEMQLCAYFEVTIGAQCTAGDVTNLVQQSLDAVDAVVAGYPPLHPWMEAAAVDPHGVLRALGIETTDTRTLAVD